MPPEPQFPWPVHPAATMFRLLSDAELRDLAADIQARGLLEPIWLCTDPELGLCLLDGRNRYLACKLAGVEPRTRHYEGADPVEFAWSQNMHRRHLTTGEKAAAGEAMLALYESRARRGRPAGAPSAAAGKRAPQSRDLAAAVVGVSGRAMAQWKRVRAQAPDLADKVRNGAMALDRAERIIRDRVAERRRIEEARQQAAQRQVSVRIEHGDFRRVLAGLSGVDAIITDPPYLREYIPLMADLARWADQVLAPDGILAVLMGQSHLPEVYRLLGGCRPYRWTACYLTPGSGYAALRARVQTNWKPLLIYGGGRSFGDVFRSDGLNADAKGKHQWGQDFGGFFSIVQRLTLPGQTVCDPFMGSGTTLLAAKALGRHVIGCDIDGESVRTARERLS